MARPGTYRDVEWVLAGMQRDDQRLQWSTTMAGPLSGDGGTLWGERGSGQ